MGDMMLMEEEKRKDVARIGVQGVTLKKFEEIVADILPHCTPVYSPLPGLPDASTRDKISCSVLENSIFRAKLESDGRYFNVCRDDDGNDNHDDDDEEEEEKKKKTVVVGHGIVPPEWPFNSLPLEASIRSNINCPTMSGVKSLPGADSTIGPTRHGMRAVRKEWQLKSLMQCVMSMLPSSAFGGPLVSKKEEGCLLHVQENKLRIVDFAGGTGHLSIPLALMLPRVEVVLVDLKRSSLDLALEKVESLMTMPKTETDLPDIKTQQNEIPCKEDGQVIIHHEGMKLQNKRISKSNHVTVHGNILEPTALSNLYLYHGSISSFAKDHSDFDIALGLHACGEATDHILRASGVAGAHFIVSPCCVGKLNQSRRDPYIYRATASNEPTVTYPQSSIFGKIIPQKSSQFDILAKAADYSDWQDMRTSRNANRRTAKALVEMDRLLYMKETFGYDEIVLTRMDPWEASPKNDILMGWNYDHIKGLLSPYSKDILTTTTATTADKTIPTCPECNKDIKISMDQLLCPPTNEKNRVHVDWTIKDSNNVKCTLQEFAKGPQRIMRFPPGQGKHFRKLVHFIAEELKLRHWSEGKKNAEKIVVVAK